MNENTQETTKSADGQQPKSSAQVAGYKEFGMNNFAMFHKFIEDLRKTEDVLSTTIKIDHRQMQTIVITDLFNKYKYNIENKNVEWAIIFEKVLRYYISAKELKKLKTQNSL